VSDYILDKQVGFLLRLASQRHSALFQSLMVDGITPTQFSALIRIDENGECSQNQLGRLAGMDVATIKGVADRLREKGLIQTRSDPNDKRRSLISLTSGGEVLIEKLKGRGQKISKQTLDPLSPQEREQLLSALRKIT
jgi:DNA-binding MarR family transcriptional regulator